MSIYKAGTCTIIPQDMMKMTDLGKSRSSTLSHHPGMKADGWSNSNGGNVRPDKERTVIYHQITNKKQWLHETFKKAKFVAVC